MSNQPVNQQQGNRQQAKQAGGESNPARQQQQFEAGDGGNLAEAIRENMEVIGLDGVPVGFVDRIEGGTIKLERNAETGQHGYLPLERVQGVDGNKVRLGIDAADAKRLAAKA